MLVPSPRTGQGNSPGRGQHPGQLTPFWPDKPLERPLGAWQARCVVAELPDHREGTPLRGVFR